MSRSSSITLTGTAIFIASKGCYDVIRKHGNGDAAVDASLERLGVDYISCTTASPPTM